MEKKINENNYNEKIDETGKSSPKLFKKKERKYKITISNIERGDINMRTKDIREK